LDNDLFPRRLLRLHWLGLIGDFLRDALGSPAGADLFDLKAPRVNQYSLSSSAPDVGAFFSFPSFSMSC
jgi:hypothetical protein